MIIDADKYCNILWKLKIKVKCNKMCKWVNFKNVRYSVKYQKYILFTKFLVHLLVLHRRCLNFISRKHCVTGPACTGQGRWDRKAKRENYSLFMREQRIRNMTQNLQLICDAYQFHLSLQHIFNYNLSDKIISGLSASLTRVIVKA